MDALELFSAVETTENERTGIFSPEINFKEKSPVGICAGCCMSVMTQVEIRSDGSI
jgi:hypothetical protein